MGLCLIPRLYERHHGRYQFVRRVEVTVPQYTTTEDAEPQFNLVKPRAVRWCVVKYEAIAMPLVPFAQISALVRVAMRIQVVKNDMNVTLSVNRRNSIHERQKVRPPSLSRTLAKHFACSHVETGEQTTCAVPLVLEIEASITTRCTHLERATTRQRLHAGLLVDTQYRLALWQMDIQIDDLPHLLLIGRVVAVTPHLDTVRLDLRIFQNTSDRSGTDRANQTRRHDRRSQSGVVPQYALKSEVRWRAARRGNHLVSFQRGNLCGSSGTRQILQSVETMLFEPLEPLPNTSSAGSDVPGDGGDRFAVRCEKDHTRAAVETGFAALLPSDCPKIIPFSLRKSEFHVENIGKKL